jgi:hypothetical protein
MIGQSGHGGCGEESPSALIAVLVSNRKRIAAWANSNT